MADPIFTDSFSTGDLSHTEGGAGWNSQGPNVSVVSNFGRSDSNSLRFRYGPDAPGQDTNAEQRFSFPQATEVWFEWYVHIPSNFVHRDEAPSSDNNKLFALWATNYNLPSDEPHIVWEYTQNSSFPSGSFLRLASASANDCETRNTGPSTYDNNFVINYSSDPGSWVQLRFHVRISATSSILDVWKNGTKIGELIPSDFKTTCSGWANYVANGFLLGWSNSGFEEVTDFHVDDFKIWTDEPDWFTGGGDPEPQIFTFTANVAGQASAATTLTHIQGTPTLQGEAAGSASVSAAVTVNRPYALSRSSGSGLLAALNSGVSGLEFDADDWTADVAPDSGPSVVNGALAMTISGSTVTRLRYDAMSEASEMLVYALIERSGGAVVRVLGLVGELSPRSTVEGSIPGGHTGTREVREWLDGSSTVVDSTSSVNHGDNPNQLVLWAVSQDDVVFVADGLTESGTLTNALSGKAGIAAASASSNTITLTQFYVVTGRYLTVTGLGTGTGRVVRLLDFAGNVLAEAEEAGEGTATLDCLNVAPVDIHELVAYDPPAAPLASASEPWPGETWQLEIDQELGVSVDGVASVAASVSVRRGFAAQTDGAGDASIVVSQTHELAATVSGSTTTRSEVTVEHLGGSGLTRTSGSGLLARHDASEAGQEFDTGDWTVVAGTPASGPSISSGALTYGLPQNETLRIRYDSMSDVSEVLVMMSVSRTGGQRFDAMGLYSAVSGTDGIEFRFWSGTALARELRELTNGSSSVLSTTTVNVADAAWDVTLWGDSGGGASGTVTGTGGGTEAGTMSNAHAGKVAVGGFTGSSGRTVTISLLYIQAGRYVTVSGLDTGEWAKVRTSDGTVLAEAQESGATATVDLYGLSSSQVTAIHDLAHYESDGSSLVEAVEGVWGGETWTIGAETGDTYGFEASIPGTAAVSASMSVVRAVSASVAGEASAEATVTYVEGGETFELAAQADGAASTGVALSVVRSLAAQADGVASNLDEQAIQKQVPRSAQADGVAAVSVTVDHVAAPLAVVSSSASTSASLSVVYALQGQAAGVASTETAVQVQLPRDAETSGAATASASPSVVRALQAQVGAVGATEASLFLSSQLHGAVDGIGSAAAALSAVRGVASEAGGSALVTAQLEVLASRQATAEGVATVTASVSRRLARDAEASGTSSVTASLSRLSSLSALAEGSSTASAEPNPLPVGRLTVEVSLAPQMTIDLSLG